jgi:hypothetical protein
VVDTNLTINIPQNAFQNGFRGCIIIAQSIPDTATVNMPVVITIGGNTATTYPLTNRCGAPVTAGNIKTRTRYPFKVVTTPTSANFTLLCGVPCTANNLQGIPVITDTPAVGG